MKKFYVLLLLTASFLVGFVNVAYSQSDTRGMVMCDRIEKQGVCEEYRLNTLSRDDKEIILKHCTSDALCPEQDRVAQCINYKDTDGVLFNKHYYHNDADKEAWQADFIKETCIKNNGEYEAN